MYMPKGAIPEQGYAGYRCEGVTFTVSRGIWHANLNLQPEEPQTPKHWRRSGPESQVLSLALLEDRGLLISVGVDRVVRLAC